MEIQECSPPEYNLVFDWAEKWFDLIELINNVTGTDDVLDPVSPPTESDELQYQSLRSWHFKHETQFVPLWEVFYKSHDWSIDRSNVDEDFDFPQKYLQNPFLFFYEPETLYKLAQQLGLQNEISIWEPNEYMTSHVRPIYIRLAQLLIEFLDWMDERISG